ncbi:MAG: TRAP transporter substrate-binding protein DctP [Deltaproteobacteria bacterium]|nr:TRAP transporter substrate-binding protein DctP [Deltaproteobacteria bacterium]
MKLQGKVVWFLAWLCLTVVLPLAGRAEPTVLKLATLAPEGSAWMDTFHRMNRELESRTKGTLKLRAYPGGVMGEERVVLRKMRIGQIQIAGLTGLGLSSICKDIQALGTPFLFRNYGEVDFVLPRVTARLEKILLERGYVLLGWVEIGFVYMMSNKPVANPRALRGTKVWMPEGDRVSQAVFEKAGVAPVPLGVSDVLLALQTGLVDVVYSAPVAAIVLQWFTKVKYVTRVPLSYAFGGVIMTRRAFDRLSRPEQQALQDIFRIELTDLNTRTRRDNEEALGIMEDEGIRSVELTGSELALFQKIAGEAVEDLAGNAFSAGILEEIKTYLREVRRGN